MTSTSIAATIATIVDFPVIGIDGTSTATKPASRAATQLSIVGSVFMGVLALTLSACGDGGQAAAGRGAATQPEERPETTAAGKRCRDQLGGFLHSLDALRSRLAVGLSYDKYLDEVRDVRAAYHEIPVNRLMVDCLMTVGTPSERALNEYIEAVNTWGECLATVTCESDSIEPKLQRKWQQASNSLTTAHSFR